MAKFVKIHDIPSGTASNRAAFISGPGVTVVDTNTAQTLTNKTFTGAVSANAVVTNTTLGVAHQNLTAVGTAISDAAAIANTTGSVLVTGGNNAVGVQMPVASSGRVIFVKNADASNGILLVYPQVNSTINAIAANSALAMAAKTSATFFGTNATNWVTIPLLPS